jgi:hypothetical protein
MSRLRQLVQSFPMRGRRAWLLLAVLYVVVVRLGLYIWQPDRGTDFDLLYHAAEHFIRGENPYPIALTWFQYPLFYPMPAVLLAIPFTAGPLEVARPLFDILVGSAFGYALWVARGSYALLALASGGYIYALRYGQTTPLMVAASLLPAYGFLLSVKPNIGLALWLARPNRQAVIGVVAALGVALVLLPSWPRDWLQALEHQNAHLLPPILRPFGWLLLLAVLRWRSPEGRLLLALAVIPQNTLPHELVPLALIPGNLVEMAIFIVGSWLSFGAAAQALQQVTTISAMADRIWPMLLVASYLPMLWLVLRRSSEAPVAQLSNDDAGSLTPKEDPG